MAKKPRKGLDTIAAAARMKEAGAPEVVGTVPIETITTSFHIPKTTHDLLRSVAFKRAKESGGRASVSAVLTEMVEANRKALEKEAGPFL